MGSYGWLKWQIGISVQLPGHAIGSAASSVWCCN